ncbi:hypothetical protein D3C81_1977050 [compost metagenome]
MQGNQELIYNPAVNGEHLRNNTGYDDPGYKVRQIRYCLNGAFENSTSQLVQEYRKKDWDDKSEYDS